MNETSTNFFEVLQQPLPQPIWNGDWVVHSSLTRTEALQELLNTQPLVTPEPGEGGSALSSLWTWSLQFEIPIWLIALLALGLALSVLWHLRASFPAPAAQVHRNRQAHIVNSILR